MTALDGVCPNGPFGTASPEARAEVERIAAEMSAGGSRAERAAQMVALAAEAGWTLSAEDAAGFAEAWLAPVLDEDGQMEGFAPARSLYLCGCFSWRPAIPVPTGEVAARMRWAFSPECPVGHAGLEGWQITRRGPHGAQ